MSDRLDKGKKSDEGNTDVDAYYSCDECGQGFTLPQELEEHESSRHQSEMGQCFKDLNLVTSNIGGLNDRQIKRSHIVLSVN